MAEQLVQITDLSKTPLIWLQPNKYAPNDIVIVFPNSAEFPAGTAGTIPNGTPIRIINFTDQDEKFTLRRSGTDTIQDFSTGDYLADSVIREEFYRAEYVLDNGQWKIGMLNFPAQLTPRQSAGPAETLVQNDMYLYDGATQTSITVPSSASSMKNARFGLHETGGANNNVQLIAQGSDTFEVPETLGTFVTSHNLHWPHSKFEWAIGGTTWRLVEKMPRDPRIGNGVFTPLVNVGAAFTTTINYTVLQYGKQNVYISMQVQWTPPGGSPTMDWYAQWTLNGVPQGSPIRFLDSTKPSTTIETVTWSPWLDILVPGDLVEIQVRNAGVGQLDTLSGDLQLMGPFI